MMAQMQRWLKDKLPLVLAVAAALQGFLLCSSATATEPVSPLPRQYDLQALLANVPDGSRWVQHLQNELLPFWEMETALGTPHGNFPTYRCNDGSLYDLAQPCPELQYGDVSGTPPVVLLDRQYLRAFSRQVYAYAVAYHMTGNETYLQYALDGVDYIRSHFLDRTNPDPSKYPANRKNYGAYTYLARPAGVHTGPFTVPGPASRQRTSQDLAYAVTGMGFVYYLTRNPELLEEILALKDYIFETYYDQELDRLVWVLDPTQPPDTDTPDRREITAELDQVYAYMLLLTPALPSQQRQQWENDLVHMARILIDQFYSARQNLYFGLQTSTETRRLEQAHTDFGHSIKTMWMTYLIGRMTNHVDLIDFGRTHATALLEQAFIPETGSWGNQPRLDGTVDPTKVWWALAELDQVSATLSLLDPNYAGHLMTTYNYWFTYMVDHEHSEIWHLVDPNTNQPYPCGRDVLQNCLPKQHSWKNALHSFEHALVGYITGEELHDKPVTLYYAFPERPAQGTIRPYFYTGHLSEYTELRQNSGRCSLPRSSANCNLQRVTFTAVR